VRWSWAVACVALILGLVAAAPATPDDGGFQLAAAILAAILYGIGLAVVRMVRTAPRRRWLPLAGDVWYFDPRESIWRVKGADWVVLLTCGGFVAYISRTVLPYGLSVVAGALLAYAGIVGEKYLLARQSRKAQRSGEPFVPPPPPLSLEEPRWRQSLGCVLIGLLLLSLVGLVVYLWYYAGSGLPLRGE
jgi:hypothetical protein